MNRKELQEEYRWLLDKANTTRGWTGDMLRREKEISKLLNLCKCRNCGKEYDEQKARGNWKGFCSAKCQHEKAKELGYRKGKKPSEYEFLNRAKCIGSDFVIK